MAESEKLKFSIKLSANIWQKKPKYTILVDDEPMVSGEVGEPQEIISFEKEVLLGTHELSIRLENKESSDTILKNSEIVKDMLLNIDDIEIDNVSLSYLIWTKSTYYPDQPQEFNGSIVNSLSNCVNLGWNGTYKIQFNSPFYIWLLENI
jgi:hypothetical protein